MFKPKAVVCAYSSVGTAALEGLLEAGVEVLALYTYRPTPDEAWFTPPAVVAEAHGIPVHHPSAFNDNSVFDSIQGLRPDFLFSFYFREMIQARFLDIPRLGAYNLHGSLLPKYRGRAPINWVLVKGETETGVTLHAMTPKPDDGAIVAQARLPIAWDETALSLTHKAATAGRDLVRHAIPGLVDGTIPRLDQKTLGPSSYFGGRKPSDSRLDPSMRVAEAFNQIRAVADPWPNAFLEAPVGTVKVAWALPCAEPCPPGQFRLTRDGVLIGFADGALRLHTLKTHEHRVERPTEQAQILRELGWPEA
ncbi:formyltransferase family protein [Geothrix sp. PMB-07]|uniref:formyltransferase family protein n=1 Tax=Geothrix sp. PMB-07 TaxID=3068640 RepID=UPI0027422B9A|nr:formyltransferase family protein [Geothrix sp. PMB-07]WLT32569.1 formyltransferase family protein [Geothrix sp. PMB-07]